MLGILSVPVYTPSEYKNLGQQDPAFDMPRAVIHLVNKKPTVTFDGITEKELLQQCEFSRGDLDRLQEFALTVGLCHANIKKIEQLHMMPDITHNITSANNQMQETLELSQQGF
jgi:hypothetical protein